MVIKNVNLEIVCGVTSKVPDTAYAEVAFAGKSNVGKSSLINALMNRKALARTSAQPGKTQTINFYNINDAMYLVDLPGYGYAKASEEVKAKWGKMIENYLHTSKQLKAVGRASLIPVSFAVNEPILFGAPIVLNPVLFVPFILAPIANVWLYKFFVDVLGMNAFSYILPWTTPGTIGLIVATGFAKLSFFLAPLLLVVDAVIYYPFFRAYDKQLVEREALIAEGAELDDDGVPVEEAVAVKEVEVKKEEPKAAPVPKTEKKVLVLCASGATSSMLAKAIVKGAKAANAPVDSIAMAYGQHKDCITDYDLIVLAPQMASMFDELKHDCDEKGVPAATCSGKEYVGLTRNPAGALEFALAHIA